MCWKERKERKREIERKGGGEMNTGEKRSTSKSGLKPEHEGVLERADQRSQSRPLE